MSPISRRELLTYFALAPTLPRFFVQSAQAAQNVQPFERAAGYDGPIVVVVRMMGGNDGLNTVVPFRDDRYYKARPTIGIPKSDLIVMDGADMGLNPWLGDVRRLMDEGHAAIVQGVGHANPTRSHPRETEILETGSLAEKAPAQGWLGRYLDHACECEDEPLAGVQFADTLGRTLATASGRSKSIASPQGLLDVNADAFAKPTQRGSQPIGIEYLRQVENDLVETGRQVRRAAQGHGGAYEYPDSVFGQSLRWTGDMIETGCPTRAYYVTIGAFDTLTTPTFDTHVYQLAKHKLLFTELGRGLRAFRDHMRKAGQLNRILLMTFSDFGRHVEENRDGGTEHGNASLLFLMGGKVRPGLIGSPADLGRVQDGGLDPGVDFRQVYASILGDWLKIDADAILGERIDPYRVVVA